jgi:signal transduction histidine kinase
MISTLIIILLIAGNILMLVFFVAEKRRSRRILAEVAALPKSLPRVLERLNSLLDSPDAENNLEEWTSFALEAVSADLPFEDVVLISRHHSKNEEGDSFVIAAGRGTGPLGNSASEKTAVSFNSLIHKHFFWSKEPQIIQTNALSQCLPAEYVNQYNSALAGVFDIAGNEAAIILLGGKGANEYSLIDKNRFESVFRIIRAGYSLINYHLRESELRRAADRAHEEGMLQISTGIIHNIGNGIVVIKMTLDRIRDFRPIIELINFLKDELLSKPLSILEEGKNSDSRESLTEHLKTALEVSEKLSVILTELSHDFSEVASKFQSVVETISLQQQFIGELGTENVVPFRLIIEDTLKMSELPIANNHIELQKNIKSRSSVLVDAALLRQVLLSIIKCSVNSINKIRRSPSFIKIDCFDQSVENTEEDKESTKKFICLEIRDNGYGAAFADEKEKSRKSSPAAQENRELLFCKSKIEKYQGYFKIESLPGSGSVFKIGLPVYESDKDK